MPGGWVAVVNGRLGWHRGRNWSAAVGLGAGFGWQRGAWLMGTLGVLRRGTVGGEPTRAPAWRTAAAPWAAVRVGRGLATGQEVRSGGQMADGLKMRWSRSGVARSAAALRSSGGGGRGVERFAWCDRGREG
ncbi:uncharacterized protein A4U43_C03F28100 [Asparagus officinalis]|uniref:Uncharacterized protein n=1 Tax=Asparagus officinalis TaxID=4686 RepID=A0A5P1FDM0_ASPOF|nr:uncharacterized protein A4U43_C03F28100 [Asparagus officinalis]